MAGDRVVSPTAPSDCWGTGESGAVEWEYLYERYAQPLRVLIARRVPDGEPVEDILHDTFARAMRSTRLIDTHRPPWPFLATVAGRTVADWWSRNDSRRQTQYPVRMATEEYPGSDAHALSLDRIMGARRALLAMTPRHRRVLYLYEGEGWSYDALTEAEQVSVMAMKSLLGRARSCFHARYRELVAGDASLIGLVWLRVRLARLRARLDQWQGGRWESLAAVGGIVVAGAVIAGATSPLASATVTVESQRSPSFSAPLFTPTPQVERGDHGGPNHTGNHSGLVDNQQTRPAAPSPFALTQLLVAGGGIVNGPDDSTASFYVTVDPVIGNEKRFGTETRCNEGDVAARKCEVIRALPASS